MSNYVLKYSRGEKVKYISHLDFIRMFHRSVRRSGLPMAFSQGFNPHPIMTVAMPLSVGVTSDSEYMKIGFDGDFSEDKIISDLNRALPDGFEVLAAKKVEGKELDFAKFDRAEYIVEAELEEEAVPDIEEFLQNEQILVMKKSKSGVRETDIRPYIHKFEILEKNGKFIKLFMCIAAGNQYNLKPETVLEGVSKYQPEIKIAFAAVHRKKILAGDLEYL